MALIIQWIMQNMGASVFTYSSGGMLIISNSFYANFTPAPPKCPPAPTRLKKVKFGIGQKVYTKDRREFIVIGLDATQNLVIYTIESGGVKYRIPESNLFYFTELAEIEISLFDQQIASYLSQFDKLMSSPIVPDPLPGKKVISQAFRPAALDDESLKLLEQILKVKSTFPICQTGLNITDPEILKAIFAMQKKAEEALKRLEKEDEGCV